MDVGGLSPLTAGFVVGFDVFLVQFDDSVIAFVDVQIEPVAIAVFLADADVGRDDRRRRSPPRREPP